MSETKGNIMSTKMECLTCNGQGWVEGFEGQLACCGGSGWECGASGCTGPIEEVVQVQIDCDDCQGTGFNLPIHETPMEKET